MYPGSNAGGNSPSAPPGQYGSYAQPPPPVPSQYQQQQHHQQQYGGTSTALTLDGDIPEAHVVEAMPIQDQHQQYQQQAHQQQYQQQYQGYTGAYAQPSYSGSGAGVGMDSSGPTKYGSNAQPLMGGGPTVMPLPGGQTPDTSEFGFLFGRRRLVIKQKFDMMEAAAQAIGCGCIEQANEYYVFDFDTGEEILLVKEESEMFQRGCCHPHHSATLHYFDVRQGVPPSTVAMRTEKPFKLGCCACFDICRHEAKAKLPDGTKFSHVTTPFMGGGLAPKMEVMSRNGTVDATITGPTCCLGGLIELCQDIEFDYHKGKQEQIIGRIVKKKPDNTQGRLHEIAGDADMFVLELPPDATPEQAASMLSSALLLDYLYFEGGGPFQYNPADGSCQINICNCYCLGCVCPCQCQCGGNNSD